ncbi:MAG: hypothetical protein KAI47_25355, partial [Deltaproteobacteria bacterium]|nr:hypothetical protein [Deltaproteobacteria bacterium]
HEKFEASLRLDADAVVDRENVEHLVGEFFLREKLLTQITRLEAPFQIGIEGQVAWRTAADLSDEDLQTTVFALTGSGSALVIRRSWQRSDPIIAEASFADIAGEALDALLPIFHGMAWSRENDHLSMRETLKDKDRERMTKGLAPNDRVRITGGMLAGRTGVVQETSDKGDVKVLIGTLSLKVKSDALTKI